MYRLQRADVDLILSARTAGKEVGPNVYAHRSALPAWAKHTLDDVDDTWNVVRLPVRGDTLSLLHYPLFDHAAFPTLARSVTVYLDGRKPRERRYRRNRPVLHRKELMVPDTYPQRDAFARLTTQADRVGLFDNPPSRIGFERYWNGVLSDARVRVKGHTLITPDDVP